MTQQRTTERPEPPGEPLAYLFRDLLLIGNPGVTRLYLIRHGQAEHNLDPSAGDDAALTQVGREQARRLAARLARQGVDAIYSSTMRRAIETAEAVAQAVGMEIRVQEGLQEVDVQTAEQTVILEGAEAEELRERFLADPTWDVLPGAEDRLSFRRRVVDAIDHIVAEQPGRRVAVVCHGFVIQTYVAHALRLDTDFPFYPFNSSITSIRALGERRAIWRLNDIAHLDGLPAGYDGIS
jgi:probable phosphoglycerate mutase